MAFRGEGPWGVTTLVINPASQEPNVALFPAEGAAIQYARQRAKASAPSRRPGGPTATVYYILYYAPGEHDSHGRRVGLQKYRVLRGSRGAGHRKGTTYAEPGREQIMVFNDAGVLPNGKTKWVLNKGYTVDVPDIEAERETARRAKGPKKMTIWERRGDPQE